MEKIRCLIADDDPGMRLLLRRIIEKSQSFCVCAEAQNGREALGLLHTGPQVCFLDVEMPEMDGVTCAHLLQQAQPQMPLIFATAHEGYMREAFEVYAFDYLLKPFDVSRVQQTLERVRQQLSTVQVKPVEKPEKKLRLQQGEEVCFVPMESILLVQREGRVTAVYTAKERYTVPDSLAALEEELDEPLFFRSHRSYIINTSAVEAISPYGRWTYVVKLKGLENDALLTVDRAEELEKRMRGEK